MSQKTAHKTIRVRFAPSPTGLVTLGNARTALFNWLFARHMNGTFVLRVEDTDKERSRIEFETGRGGIIETLHWLGLDPDEGPEQGGTYGPYRQSERLDLYEKYLRQLLEQGSAYYCFCAKEELELDRQAMLAQGIPPKYSGRCRSMQRDEAEKRIQKGESAVIRFKIPEVKIEFTDMIRGKVKFDGSLLGDVVIAKSIREPLYNFAVTIDDHLMQITHVIRGEDHISNTPKQICMQKALKLNDVQYAHLPLLLAPDRSKLSKRHIETSIADYKEQGYLPEALVNFLALLGWHPKDDTEILNREELIKEFDLKRVQKAGAVFNIEKLAWMNAQYIKHMSVDELMGYLSLFIPRSWQKDNLLLKKAVQLEQERLRVLTDFKNLADFFFALPHYEKELLFWPRPVLKDTMPIGNTDKIKANIKLLEEEITKIFGVDFTKENLEKVIMPLAEVWGRGELLWPLRVALSGKEASPGPFEIMDVLGKEETLQRIKIAIDKLAT